MFPSGSAAMNPRSMDLLEKVAEVVKTLPNKIEISGHTDAKPYAGGDNYTNWELSADRANASRRVLVGAGISAERLTMIKGQADTDPFVKADPFDPQKPGKYRPKQRVGVIAQSLPEELVAGSEDEVMGVDVAQAPTRAAAYAVERS